MVVGRIDVGGIIGWVVLDPVIVVTHDRNIPLGYDAGGFASFHWAHCSPRHRDTMPSAGLCYVGGQLL